MDFLKNRKEFAKNELKKLNLSYYDNKNNAKDLVFLVKEIKDKNYKKLLDEYQLNYLISLLKTIYDTNDIKL